MDYLMRRFRRSDNPHKSSNGNTRETTQSKSWGRRIFLFGTCAGNTTPLVIQSYEDIFPAEWSRVNVAAIKYTDRNSGNTGLGIKNGDTNVQIGIGSKQTKERFLLPFARTGTTPTTEAEVGETIDHLSLSPISKRRSWSMAMDSGNENFAFRSNENSEQYFLPFKTKSKPAKELDAKKALALSSFPPVPIRGSTSMTRNFNETLSVGLVASSGEDGNVGISSEN